MAEIATASVDVTSDDEIMRILRRIVQRRPVSLICNLEGAGKKTDRIVGTIVDHSLLPNGTLRVVIRGRFAGA